MLLSSSYYQNENVIEIAKDLIGKTLCTKIDGRLTSGIITETEAYNGIIDKASHAFGERRTKRTETMYAKGGVSYVYLCYGIHHLFNIVTNGENIPHAVLIRAISPDRGINTILKRRKVFELKKDLCIGPGKVSEALGIKTMHDNLSLTGKKIWLCDENIKFDRKKINVGPRIGVDYAGKDALLPYRFFSHQFH
jgi:DNA-3-methyladenine glycosylase